MARLGFFFNFKFRTGINGFERLQWHLTVFKKRGKWGFRGIDGWKGKDSRGLSDCTESREQLSCMKLPVSRFSRGKPGWRGVGGMLRIGRLGKDYRAEVLKLRCIFRGSVTK